MNTFVLSIFVANVICRFAATAFSAPGKSPGDLHLTELNVAPATIAVETSIGENLLHWLVIGQRRTLDTNQTRLMITGMPVVPKTRLHADVETKIVT